MKGKIAEVFSSVQCEGLYLGEKQIFVRFFGCNLSCKFCDTKLNRYNEFSAEELNDYLKQHRSKHNSISFTGGEPLYQKDFLKEIAGLTRIAGFKNYLETNGTLPKELEEVIDLFDIVAMDIKLPSSTGMDNFWEAHRSFMQIASRKEFFLKAVICESTTQEDLEAAIKLIKEDSNSAVLVLQANSEEDHGALQEKLEGFKGFCTKNNITACIIPQLQRTLWIK
jgi:7-carboxy-7-deazaguanine synthase